LKHMNILERMEAKASSFSKGQRRLAEYISNNILTLPLYADLKLEEVDRICDIILN